MSLPMRYAAKALLLFLVLGVAGAQAQQSANAEPQAPSGAVPGAREVVPPLPVPRLVKFAGALKDEQGKPRTDTVGVTFAIYKEQEGGAALWLETQNVELDEQGRYTVLLGATKSEGLPLELFSAGEPRWLGVQVNLPHEVEQPRVLFVSVPYALKAADADTLGGKPLSSFVLAGSAGGSGAGGILPTTSGGIGTAAIGGGGSANVVAKFDPSGANVVNSSLTDNGTVVSTPELVGIGTSNPQAQLDVQVSTGSPTNAINSTIFLNNSSAITGNVVSAMNLQFADNSTATNLSKQSVRMVYIRQPTATGGVSAFDSVFTTSAFLHANTPYQLRGMNIEGPTMDAGTTLGTFYGGYIGSGGGAGTVTNRFALVTEPNAGNVGIGTTAPTAPLEVAGNLKLSGVGNAIIFPNGTVMSSAATGVGGGTITGVTAGTGLTGGGTAGGVTLGIANGGVTNALLSSNSVTNTNIADGSLSPAKITGTAATLGANSFVGNQAINGNETISGNVGINNSNPSATVDVAGNVNITQPAVGATGITPPPVLQILGGKGGPSNGIGGPGQSGQGAAVNITAGAGGDVSSFGIGASGGGVTITAGAGSGGLGLGSPGTGGSITLQPGAGGIAGTIGSTGNVFLAPNGGLVGVGTTTPATALHVSGTGDTEVSVQSTATGGRRWTVQSSATSNLAGVFQIIDRTAGLSRLSVNAAGNVGIGTTTPSATLEVKAGGTTLADAWTVRSSRRWKSNIHPLVGALETVRRLRGVSYDQTSDGKHQIGVIAEEVGKVLPEIVMYEKNGVDAEGVDYARLTALLIEATKEQQREIQRLTGEVRKMRKAQEGMTQLQARLTRLESQQKPTPTEVSAQTTANRSHSPGATKAR